MSFDYKKNRPWAENLTIVMQIGLTMAGCIAFCFFIGLKLVLTSFTGRSWRSFVTRRKTKKDGKMESIRSTQKKYGSRALAIAVIIGFGTVLIGQNSLGKGLVLGTLFSVVNFIIMGETLPLKLGRSGKTTFFISLFSMLLRYLLLAVPLVIAVKYEQFHIISAIIGVFMVQVVIVADHLGIQIPATRKKTS